MRFCRPRHNPRQGVRSRQKVRRKGSRCVRMKTHVVVPAYIQTIYNERPKWIDGRRLANFHKVPYDRCVSLSDKNKFTAEQWEAMPKLYASQLDDYDEEGDSNER
jgi:hypothetical protein